MKNELFLILKKQWYDMIASGEKLEEYREITPYWIKRIWDKKPSIVTFQLGYSKKQRMKFKIERVLTYIPSDDIEVIRRFYKWKKSFEFSWGFDDVEALFVIRLGEKIPLTEETQ